MKNRMDLWIGVALLIFNVNPACSTEAARGAKGGRGPFEHVTRLARPGGNLTGVTCMTTELSLSGEGPRAHDPAVPAAAGGSGDRSMRTAVGTH